MSFILLPICYTLVAFVHWVFFHVKIFVVVTEIVGGFLKGQLLVPLGKGLWGTSLMY